MTVVIVVVVAAAAAATTVILGAFHTKFYEKCIFDSSLLKAYAFMQTK
jgi:hypothetical protein